MKLLLDRPIALEITLPEPLFRRLQQMLDTHRTQSIDDLAASAIALYLTHLNQH